MKFPWAALWASEMFKQQWDEWEDRNTEAEPAKEG